MDELERWLAPLGLAQLAPVLRAHDIDLDILSELTEADLEKLGLSLGHRRKLLKSAACLPHPPSSPSAPSAEPKPSPAASASAERRQLTVMFCDLVGSTALARRLDPEDLREVIGAYHRCIAETIARLDGFVAKYMGDGALVYFGYPQAHEDDAERAVRAGLTLIDAVGQLQAPERLRLRIGIGTGLVVVGDLVGSGEAQERGVVGETPNLASRLQAIGEPNTIVVGPTTHRLLGDLFEYRDLGTIEVKGYPQPVQAYQVLRSSAVESRFEAFHGAALTPLVGREEEIELLLRRWAQAKEGEGRVVLLSGEPGIGKSRLAKAVQGRIESEPHVRLRYFCSPFFQGSALHPTIARLERAAGFGREDTAETKLGKLEALLAPTTPPQEDLALLAELLSLPAAVQYPPLNLSPQRKKEKTFEALLRQIELLARRRPVLMIYEDVHWIDPSSRELLDLVVERVQRLPVLLLITFRPEFQPPWTGQAQVTMLTLNRLDRTAGAALVQRVAGNVTLPIEVLEEIVARTDGVPLFVEELTKAVLEAGAGEADAKAALSRTSPGALAVPATLHASLMARLDRLGSEAEEVAQTGAAIGREFTDDLIRTVSPLPEAPLQSALEQLAASQLIFRRGSSPHAAYSFKHALVQDTAYGTLLRSKRRALHARIARALEEKFPDIAATQPEVLAHHFTEADLLEPAAESWLKAGRRAKEVYANSEAVSHLQRCLKVIEAPLAGADDRATSMQERKLQTLVLLGDLASLAGNLEEANRCYEQALDLPSSSGTRTWIDNKRHRPRAVLRDGARIAFYEHGGGDDTLLFVAPLAYGLAAFQPVVERLCQEFRIITVDPRGSRASAPLVRPYPLTEHVKDIRAVIDTLGSKPVVGIGSSQSANLLFRLAHAEPWLFEKLVTIGGFPRSEPPFFAEETLNQRRELIAKGDIEGVVRSHTALVFSEPETRELKELFIQNRLKVPHETILSFFDPDPTVDVTSILPDITVPTLVTHGREDRLVLFAAAEFLAARLPNARLHAFQGKGHLPLFTATDEFPKVLRKFVRTGTVANGNET